MSSKHQLTAYDLRKKKVQILPSFAIFTRPSRPRDIQQIYSRNTVEMCRYGNLLSL